MPDFFDLDEWCKQTRNPPVLSEDQMNKISEKLVGGAGVSQEELKELVEDIISEGGPDKSNSNQSGSSQRDNSGGNTNYGLQDEYKDKLDQAIGEMTGGGIINEGGGRYQINQRSVIYRLSKKAYQESLERLRKRKAQAGNHSAVDPDRVSLSPIYERTANSTNIAILPTVRNSIVRRAIDKSEEIFEEEDIEAYQKDKEVRYEVAIVADANRCRGIEIIRNGALTLYHQIRFLSPKDHVQIYTFEHSRAIKPEELFTLEMENCHTGGDGLKHAVKKLSNARNRNKVLYLMTDGDTCGWHEEGPRIKNLKQSAEAMAKQDVHFNLIAMAYANKPFDKTVKALLKRTGGDYYRLTSDKDFGSYAVETFSRFRRT